MKIVKGIIYTLYLFVYAYGVHKTTVAPDEIIWGYICTGIFGFLFTWTVSIVIKNTKNHEKKED
jgi:hypothetical protein